LHGESSLAAALQPTTGDQEMSPIAADFMKQSHGNLEQIPKPKTDLSDSGFANEHFSLVVDKQSR